MKEKDDRHKIWLIAAAITIAILGGWLGYIYSQIWTVPQYFLATWLAKINPWMYWSAIVDILQGEAATFWIRQISMPYCVFSGSMLSLVVLKRLKKIQIKSLLYRVVYKLMAYAALFIFLITIVPIHPIMTYIQLTYFIERSGIKEAEYRAIKDIKNCPVIQEFIGDNIEVTINKSYVGQSDFREVQFIQVTYVGDITGDKDKTKNIDFTVTCVRGFREDLECVTKSYMSIFSLEDGIGGSIYCPVSDGFRKVGLLEFGKYFSMTPQAAYIDEYVMLNKLAKQHSDELKLKFSDDAKRLLESKGKDY